MVAQLFLSAVFADGLDDEDEVVVLVVLEVPDKERQLYFGQCDLALIVGVCREIDLYRLFCLIEDLKP